MALNVIWRPEFTHNTNALTEVPNMRVPKSMKSLITLGCRLINLYRNQPTEK